ncbi:hypothetical protein RYD26_06755 [Pasteurellaceae bacterium LIM206]|nr:hypothetical protein [Pasteurellaceae bacterium LIM206]
MKIYYLLPLMAASGVVQADEQDIASADQYHMQFNFRPPSMITPKTNLTSPAENQFDYQRPWIDASAAQDVVSNKRQLQINTQFSSHSNLQRALYRYRDTNYHLTAQAYRMHLDDYKDGDGNKVNAGYTRSGQLLMLGYLPTQWQEYRLGIVHDRIDDDKQPQYQMDSAYTRRIVLTANARLGARDQSNTFNLDVRHISLDRRNNNFENRTVSGTQAQMQIERDMLNIRADYRYKYGAHTSQFGVKYDNDTHLAARSIRMPNGSLARNAYRFPDIHSKHWHIFMIISGR